MHLLLKITLLLLPLQGVGGLNYPPLGWNCRCTVIQVRKGKYPESDSTAAQTAGKTATQKTPAFRFNPGKEKKLFPENVSYLKHAGNNRAERDRTEVRCQGLERNMLQKTAKVHSALNESLQCDINGNEQKIKFSDWGIKEMAQSMFGDKNFWIKNEILDTPNSLDKFIHVKSANVDLSHNTGKTLRLKKHFIKYHYIQTTLPNGKEVYLNIAEHDDGNYYLYTVTKNLPKY